MNVSKIHVTPDAEKLMGYCARVSNPANQDNPEVSKLLGYCIKHGHWSIFEMASLCLSIETSRAISAQILRHRSFSYQEFSQRYAVVGQGSFEQYNARAQDNKNRQNSLDILSEETKSNFIKTQEEVWEYAYTRYEAAIASGVAKECARFLLPMNTATKLYMHGTIRSWIHYLQLRTTVGTQKEHRDIALAAQVIFADELPHTSAALGWVSERHE